MSRTFPKFQKIQEHSKSQFLKFSRTFSGAKQSMSWRKILTSREEEGPRWSRDRKLCWSSASLAWLSDLKRPSRVELRWLFTWNPRWSAKRSICELRVTVCECFNFFEFHREIYIPVTMSGQGAELHSKYPESLKFPKKLYILMK